MPPIPTVSIILPTFNRRELLGQAIASVFAQSHRPIQLVVVDDGSTDGTDAGRDQWIVPGRACGIEVVWIRQENRGVSAARNQGLAASTGEYLLFHDSDDLLDSEKVARQVARLERTGAEVCASSLHHFDPANGRVVRRYTPDAVSPDRITPLELKRMHWGAPIFMYRRTAVQDARWDESICSAEDIDFNFQVLRRNPHACLEPQAITRVREHSDAVKLKSRPGGLEIHVQVYLRMLAHYRAEGLVEVLAAHQAKMLRTTTLLYRRRHTDRARRLFAEIQPFAPGVIAGGIGERWALQWNWCDLFCWIRIFNQWLGARRTPAGGGGAP